MITEFQGQHRWLSNFWPVVVIYDGVKYPSVENAYQAAKTLDIVARKPFESCTAGESKRFGRRLIIRKDWDQIKLDVMFSLCKQKFNQEPYRTWLLATGDQEIQEGNKWNDIFWGVCRGVGLNNLGQIIMAIRKDLRG